MQTIWEFYRESCKAAGIQEAAYTTFCGYWRSILPFIIVGKPMSDLCWTCQQNNSMILKTINRPTSEKSDVSYSLNFILCVHILQALKIAENHLTSVSLERTFYKDICKKSHENFKTCYTFNNKFQPPPFGTISRPLLLTTKIHYSFDMAQQVLDMSACIVCSVCMHMHVCVRIYSAVYMHTCSVVLCAHTCSACCSVCKYT